MRSSHRWLTSLSLVAVFCAVPWQALAQAKPGVGKPGVSKPAVGKPAPAQAAAAGVKAEPSETPGTITKWQTIRTRWIELPVPHGWKLARKCVDGEDANRIMWVYESPRKNFKLWLTVKDDKPGVPFKTLANRYWRHLQHRTNARDFQTLKEETDVTDGKELFMAVGSAEMRRFTKVHAYLVTGLLRRLKRVKKTVSASIAAEGAVLDELMPLASALMDRIKVLDGKVKAGAPAKGSLLAPPGAKPGAKPLPGKPAIKPAAPAKKGK